MDFVIADTFTDSLARLTADEQRAAKITAFDLQVNPAAPGLQFHKLERVKDKAFWSVRVSQDVRLIVHRTESSLMLCYVDHHNPAYAWAARRKLETHPRTGAAQLVEVRERIEEVVVPAWTGVGEGLVPSRGEGSDRSGRSAPSEAAPAPPPLLASRTDDELLSYGVPPEWLDDVRQATEDSLLELTDHLPGEAAEALLQLAVGETPVVPHVLAAGADPFEHPDARRRFLLVANVDEMEQALAYPWEKWIVFLHPAQRESVVRDYAGPARISGSAGTGKTVVALHRAAHLARENPDARVLLATFSDTLANALRVKLRALAGEEPQVLERLEVQALDAVALRLHERALGRPDLAPQALVRALLSEAAADMGGLRFSAHFLATEWEEVVDAWQLDTWEAYRDVARLGRRTRLPEPQRAQLWAVFDRVRAELETRALVTQAQVYGRLAAHYRDGAGTAFDFVVVDEAQDVSVPQLRFLAALGGSQPNGLFFTGDLGQRIFQQPFSWKTLGVDVRGRSRVLRVNYRTSHQIRAHADLLLGPQVTDVDGNIESRRGTVSVFNGPEPLVQVLPTEEAEEACVSAWLRERLTDGVAPHEIGLFVRSEAELPRAQAAAKRAGLAYRVLDERLEMPRDRASVATMHLAKGLEFRAVAVLACDDEVLPLQERIELVADASDMEEVYNTERQLLYVACTRARDHLLVTGVAPASEFLADLGESLPALETENGALSGMRLGPIPRPALLRHVRGSPALGLLRGLCHVLGPSVDDGPARPSAGKGDPRTLPTFTAYRSTGTGSSFTPTASPRVRRRLFARSFAPN